MSAAIAISPQRAAHGARVEHELGAAEYRRIVTLLDRKSGITMGDDKAILVRSRLQRRLRILGLPTFKAYCDFVESPSGQAEETELINALTTNLTSFFREPHHFKHLLEDVLAPLVSQIRTGKRLRIWSAGSSTGEEAYSIAMMLLSICPEAANRDVKILATDIDSAVLRTAHRGLYAKDRMKGIPAELKRKFFSPSGEAFTVSPDMKRLVNFRKLNLNAAEWPMRGQFDIIFCRNTVIYFDDDRQARMWERFRDVLAPGGYLYLGHSERLTGRAESSFERVGVTIFKHV